MAPTKREMNKENSCEKWYMKKKVVYVYSISYEVIIITTTCFICHICKTV